MNALPFEELRELSLYRCDTLTMHTCKKNCMCWSSRESTKLKWQETGYHLQLKGIIQVERKVDLISKVFCHPPRPIPALNASYSRVSELLSDPNSSLGQYPPQMSPAEGRHERELWGWLLSECARTHGMKEWPLCVVKAWVGYCKELYVIYFECLYCPPWMSYVCWSGLFDWTINDFHFQ